MKIVLKLMFVNELINEKKLIMETEIIIPGIAYPEIERLEKKFKNLFFKTLLPKFVNRAREITKNAVQNMSMKVLKFNFNMFRLSKYSGNFRDQKII